MSLAKTIRAGREGAGLLQCDMARKLRVTQSTVSDWENGVQLPRPKNLKKLARVLRLDYATLREALIAEKFA